jgi:2-keto-3-deoxy-L-rhamnonate aldolase RhmA
LAQFRWPAVEGYYDFADQNVLVIAMVEDALGVANINEIAAMPGLDVLFIGTSDLSFSLGLRGAQEHPVLEEAIGKIAAAAKQHGKILGRMARTPSEIQRFQEQGFLFLATGTELDLMKAGARQLLGASE